MWCVTIGSHQQQKILIKVQDEEKKLKLSFRGWETTVIMSQELGKHMLVCCCWNRGASLRLRFGNMKGFVGWAGGLALIQGLIAREAGSKLRLWDREKNLVTYSSKDRSSKQTEATGCWANHSVHIRTPFLACCSGGGGDSLPPDWTSEEAEEVKRGEQECIRSGPKLNLKLCCPAVIQSHAGLRMLAADSLIWIECLENKAAFVLFYCNQLTPKLDSYLSEDAQRSAWHVHGKQWRGNS